MSHASRAVSYGFCRVWCGHCRRDRVVAFSCKGRGIRPSCTRRRMSVFAANLRERVMPERASRQWVLTLPVRLRCRCALEKGLLAKVLTAWHREVREMQTRRGFETHSLAGETGLVTGMPGLRRALQGVGGADGSCRGGQVLGRGWGEQRDPNDRACATLADDVQLAMDW